MHWFALAAHQGHSCHWIKLGATAGPSYAARRSGPQTVHTFQSVKYNIPWKQQCPGPSCFSSVSCHPSPCVQAWPCSTYAIVLQYDVLLMREQRWEGEHRVVGLFRGSEGRDGTSWPVGSSVSQPASSPANPRAAILNLPPSFSPAAGPSLFISPPLPWEKQGQRAGGGAHFAEVYALTVHSTT